MKFSVEQYQEALNRLDGGVLFSGAHSAYEPKFCALELDTVLRAQPKGDTPGYLPDLRPLNDAPWSSDEARTNALLPVMAALSDWSLWTRDRRQRWATYVVVEVVKQIVAELPGLPDNIREQCRAVTDLSSAEAAAARAAWASAEASAEASEAAAARAAWASTEASASAEASSAEASASAAGRAARASAEADKPLEIACRIWIAAAKESV